MNPQGQVQVPINVNEDIKKGRYSNVLEVSQSQDEAVLDFLFVHPKTGGDIIGRIIVSPAFFKKIVELLNKLSSQKPLSGPDETKTSRIGFQPK